MIDFTQQEAYLLYSTDASVRRRAALAALREAAAAGKNVFVTDPGGKISGIAATAAAVGENAALAAQRDAAAESTVTAAQKDDAAAAGGDAAVGTEAEAPIPAAQEGITAVTFWDVYAARGLALRTTASELGPYLMAMLLELNDAQSDLLQVLYQIADDNGLLLIDTKDLRALIKEVTENPDAYEKTYGKVNGASASAILKAITLLEGRGGKDFLYEPAIDVRDFVGKGEPVAAAAAAAENTTTSAAPAEAAQAAGSTTADAPTEDAAAAAENAASAAQTEDAAAPAEDTAEGSRAALTSPRIHILDAQDLSADEGLYRVMLLYLLSECAENAENADLSSLVLIIDDAGIVLGAKDKTFAGKMRSVLSRLTEREISVIFLAENETDVSEEIRKRLVCAPAEDAAEGTEDTKAIPLARRKEILAADPLAEKYKVPFERDSAYEFLLRRGLKPAEAEAATQAADTSAEAAAQTDDAQAEAGTGGDSTVAEAASSSADTSAETGSTELKAAEASAASASEDTAKKGSGDTDEKAAKMAKRAKSSAQSLGTTVAGTVGRKIGKSIGENFGSFGSTLGGNIGASLGRGIMKTFFGE